uniref:Serine/arginine repetitive matrix 2 n=1 Tax=Macrostomum lignano TaxID=282301 RepID=A0A1I8I7F0_9PLAT
AQGSEPPTPPAQQVRRPHQACPRVERGVCLAAWTAAHSERRTQHGCIPSVQLPLQSVRQGPGLVVPRASEWSTERTVQNADQASPRRLTRSSATSGTRPPRYKNRWQRAGPRATVKTNIFSAFSMRPTRDAAAVRPSSSR